MRKLPLLLVYYLFVTPIGVLLRVTRDPMKRRVQRDADTYWTPAPVRE
ncbi:hypothetical protein [Streptomyces alkaliterrae]|uniref:Uncharacterized protein n=1 Tax=Streptomyces alkaliterrae TaxID=2213162 RepID=A0A7W3WT28_9ACTN|nr:hypothetical protein [Streptomyces alkaliterrae]MBB1253724.1 hypothetical protein [Streptomyces alkaliterrae]MBB1257984.1 hypothetical protein [Streptomyces alkaliterrae]